MASKAQQRREMTAQIIAEAVAAWDASGEKYTCLAVILDVIRPVVERRCAEHPDLLIRPRRCMNGATDFIHRRYREGAE